MNNYPLQIVVADSLYKVFPECQPKDNGLTCFSCMNNEPFSFQIAYKLVPEMLTACKSA